MTDILDDFIRRIKLAEDQALSLLSLLKCTAQDESIGGRLDYKLRLFYEVIKELDRGVKFFCHLIITLCSIKS